MASSPGTERRARMASLALRPGRKDQSPGANSPSQLRSSSQVSSLNTVFSGSG